MKRIIKLFLNISYVVSFAVFVFVTGLFNRSSNKDEGETGGATLSGNLLSINVAHADAPFYSGGGGGGIAGDSCDGSADGGGGGGDGGC